MKNFTLSVALVGTLVWPVPAPAYIDHFGLYTLGFVVRESSDIAVLRVDKVNPEKNVVLFSKVADLKGRYPDGQTKHEIAAGFRPREPRLILSWAEPGRTAVLFSNGTTAQVCVGNFWYEAAARKEAPGWWGLTHVQSILSYAYCGSAEKLQASVTDMLAGKEVVIPAVLYSGDSHAQRLATFKNIFRGKDALLIRMKAGLRMASSPLDGVQHVGTGAGGGEDVPPLLQALKEPDPQARRAAAEDLGRIGAAAQSALPALRGGLEDPDPRVRVAMAGAILGIDPKDSAALPTLIEALKNPSAALRRSAAEMLGALGPVAGASGPALAPLLADKDGSVRWAAADALGEIGPAAAPALPSLLKLLADPDPEFRGVAADALGQAAKGNAAAAAGELARLLKDGDRRVRESAARSLLELGAPCRDAIAILAASKDDPWVYAMTLAFLVRSGGLEAGPFVCEGVKHPNHEVRMAASNLLLQLDPKSCAPAIDTLIAGLKDPHYFVSARCARILFRLGADARRAAPALLDLLKHPDRDFWEARSCGAAALGAMGVRDKAMLPALLEALRQPAYQDLRLAAARVLGDLGKDAQEAAGALREAAQDKDRDVARAAGDALKRVDAKP
jgi:HEAT repeat protein